LRRIRQLGLSFLVYPGAEHSRWVHGLGVQHLARQMLDALQARYGAKGEEYKS
jgi:HD superfamily phosphohydrolase